MNSRTLLSALIFVSLFTSCKEKEVTYSRFGGFAQGTTYNIVYEDNGRINPDSIKREVESILAGFDMSLSLYKDSSILSKVNRNEEVMTDEYFREAFRISAEISQLTGGAFDITVGPLVKAWGFGPDEKKNFSDAKRDSLLALVGMEKVSLKDGKVIKTDPRISLDFNAIAQGYSVDVVYDYFKGKGIPEFLIEIGGEVRVKGDKGGKMWKIGIDKPVDNNMSPGSDLEAIISLKDKALATSGNYRKFYIENGIKYSHTIDPKTGYPAMSQLLSATILADECAVADAIATACMVMGKEKSIDFISSHPDYEGYLIFSDDKGNFQTWTSDEIRKLIEEQKTEVQ